jgi:hypothetical protein
MIKKGQVKYENHKWISFITEGPHVFLYEAKQTSKRKIIVDTSSQPYQAMPKQSRGNCDIKVQWTCCQSAVELKSIGQFFTRHELVVRGGKMLSRHAKKGWGGTSGWFV